jgi:hypothetical protein
MSRRSTFDLSEAHEVATLEVAITMLEFPERRFRRAGVEDVANFGVVSAEIVKQWNRFNKPL